MSSAIPTDAENQLRLARTDLESALRAGSDVRAESLLATYPAIAADTEAALELVYTEFVVRDELGQKPVPADWFARFPHWRSDLEQLFEVHDELQRSEASHPPQRGRGRLPARIAGYEVLEELGRGAMGVVYKARQRNLNRTVALKVILSGALAGERERARFQREAEAAARLDHPTIVGVYEVGEADGQPYCAMEYVPGGTLADRLTGTPWAPRAAAELLAALARAADHAHERGVIHRDLKPANILLNAECGVRSAEWKADEERASHSALRTPHSAFVPKIADFGLAKCLTGSDPGPTQPGDVLGTPSYMAPEQTVARSGTVGPGTDIWALGVTFYEMLTGHLPFQGETAAETLTQVLTIEPVPPRRSRPQLPRDLETVCLKCLEKDPANRYPSAAALAEDLERWLRGEPVKARPVGWFGRTVRWCRRNPRDALLSAALVGLLVGGAALFAVLWLDARAARTAEQTASRVKDDALREKDAAIDSLERQRYGAQVAAVGRAVEAGTPEEARRILAETAPRFRNLEWGVLDRLSSHRSFALPIRDNVSLVLHPDGRRVVAVECNLSGVRHECYLMSSDTSVGPPLRPRSKAGFAVRVLDFPTGTVRKEWAFPAKGWIYHVGFADGGRRLVAVADDPALTVWDLETGAVLHQLPAFARPRGRLVIPPCTTVDHPEYLAALGADVRSVRFWDARTGDELPAFELPDGQSVASFVPSPDNETFTLSARNAMSGEITRYRGRVGDRAPPRPVAANQGVLAYSPTGRWAIARGAAAELLTVLDTATWGEVAHIRSEGGSPYYGMVLSRDGRLAASLLMQGGVQVWQLNDVPAGSRLFTVAKAAPTKSAIYAKPVRSFTTTDLTGFVSFTDDNRLVVTSLDDRRVTVYDVPGTGCRDRFPGGHAEPLSADRGALPAVWFHPDGRRLFTAGPSGFDIRDDVADRPVHEDRDPTTIVHGSVPSPDGTRFVVARVPPTPRKAPPPKPGTTLEGWAVEPVRKEWSMWLPDVRLTAARYGSEGELVTIDSRGTVTVREAATGAVRSEHRGPAAFPVLGLDARTVCWIRGDNPGGALVSVTDAADGQELRRFVIPECGGVIEAATFLDARRLMVMVRSADVQVWDVEEGRHLTTVYGTGTQRFATPTADGQRVVSFGSPHLTFWDAGNWQKLYELPGAPPFWPPRGLAVSRDGGRIAAVGPRGQVRVWTTRDPE